MKQLKAVLLLLTGTATTIVSNHTFGWRSIRSIQFNYYLIVNNSISFKAPTTNASDNAKSSTTSAIDNKIQSESLSEQNANNLPTIDATNSSSNKSQKQKFVALETKGNLRIYCNIIIQ